MNEINVCLRFFVAVAPGGWKVRASRPGSGAWSRRAGQKPAALRALKRKQ
jgi:hypothetical protein